MTALHILVRLRPFFTCTSKDSYEPSEFTLFAWVPADKLTALPVIRRGEVADWLRPASPACVHDGHMTASSAWLRAMA